jgi:hypothetical protein
VIINLRADPYERAATQSGLYLRWYADNIWLFVPVQQKLGAFLTTLLQFPFQQGSSLNAAGINYNSLQAMQAMQRLENLEALPPRTTDKRSTRAGNPHTNRRGDRR